MCTPRIETRLYNANRAKCPQPPSVSMIVCRTRASMTQAGLWSARPPATEASDGACSPPIFTPANIPNRIDKLSALEASR
jgi:hypothetical protein